MLYTLNLYNAIYQLYLNRTGRIKKEKKENLKNGDIKFLLEMQINPSTPWEKCSDPYKLHIGKKQKYQKWKYIVGLGICLIRNISA